MVIDTAEAKTYALEKRSAPVAQRDPQVAEQGDRQAPAGARATRWRHCGVHPSPAHDRGVGDRRDIHLWFGSGRAPSVACEEIEHYGNPNGLQRLRQVMDTWCAIWSWPLMTRIRRTLDRWSAARAVLWHSKVKETAAERRGRLRYRAGRATGRSSATRKANLLSACSGRSDMQITSSMAGSCSGIASDQGFFHWELDCTSVFERRLQPPGR